MTRSWGGMGNGDGDGDSLVVLRRHNMLIPGLPGRALCRKSQLLDQLAHEALLWLPKQISLRWYEGARRWSRP